MIKSSYVPCSIGECRMRLHNIGIGYETVGNDVYRFNPVQKNGGEFSFYATATLCAAGIDGTDVTLELTPDVGNTEPWNVGEIYSEFISNFFRLISKPADTSDPFADAGNSKSQTEDDDNPFQGYGSEGNRTYTSPRTKFCKRCGAVIDERATVCPKCGCSQYDDIFGKRSTLVGVAAIIFSILGGWLGLAFALFGLLFYYKGEDPDTLKGRKYCKTAIGILITWVVIYVIIVVASFGAALA